jgi:multidrug resistance efflux pump
MSLPKIPIPRSQRIKVIRERVLPVMVCAATLLLVAHLWNEAVTPAMLVGEVATVQSSVNSPVPAVLERVTVERLQLVKAGDIIAELRPADPRHQLDLMQNELNLLRTAHSQQDADAAARRERLDFERLRLDWMSEKVDLATAEAKAAQAQIDLDAAQGLASQQEQPSRYMQQMNLAKQAADREVTERKALVDTLSKRIEELGAALNAAPRHTDDQLAKAIATHEKRLRSLEQSLASTTLRAPMDGIVTAVLRRSGENVVEGEPLVVISATKPERIVGYLRQPFPLEPKVGLQVEVRTQGRARARGMALITRVGTHFEPIMNPALHPAPTPEVGLPVEASLPPELNLRPGELVGLIIHSTVSQGTAL